MFKRKKKVVEDSGDTVYLAVTPWQQAVLGKRIVAMDGFDIGGCDTGIVLFEDGTALRAGHELEGGAMYDPHRAYFAKFEFWSREQTAEHYRKALAARANSVASEIADKQRVEALVSRVIPPLF
jgi:hypothetical protein